MPKPPVKFKQADAAQLIGVKQYEFQAMVEGGHLPRGKDMFDEANA